MKRYMINTEKHHKAYLIRIALWNVRLKDPYNGCPYLARDKCRLIHGGRFDNGRVLYATYLETTMTDIDARIVFRDYLFDDPCIFDSWCARYGFLLDSFRDLIKDYYKRKTELKGAKGDDAIYYGKFKNKLNALYGMAAQNVLKDDIIFEDGEYTLDVHMSDEARLLRQANKAFLPYQTGVWVTAWARWELDRAVRIADALGQFVYCDTDSCKYVGDLDWTAYNTQQERRSRENGAVAVDPDGVEHVMGVYEEDEGTPYRRFITWGSKKYAYEDRDGELHVTVSGVDKKLGAKELEEKGGLTSFQPGFTFIEAGGTESRYNDHVHFTVEIEGRQIEVTDNVVIRDSEYTLGPTSEFSYLLRHGAELWDIINNPDFDLI